MNKLFIVGNLTGDPQTRVTQNGKSVCSFTIAVNRRNRDDTDYFRISAWNDLGARCRQYLAKGRKVAVTGSVSCSTYSAQTGEVRASMNVMADEVEFLSPKDQKPEQKDSGFVEVSSEDIPWG